MRSERVFYAGEKRRPSSGTQKRIHAPSLSPGNTFEVDIEDVGHKGDGLVHIEGYTVFVPNTEKGEHVRIKIRKVLETVALAERVGERDSI